MAGCGGSLLLKPAETLRKRPVIRAEQAGVLLGVRQNEAAARDLRNRKLRAGARKLNGEEKRRIPVTADIITITEYEIRSAPRLAGRVDAERNQLPFLRHCLLHFGKLRRKKETRPVDKVADECDLRQHAVAKLRRADRCVDLADERGRDLIPLCGGQKGPACGIVLDALGGGRGLTGHLVQRGLKFRLILLNVLQIFRQHGLRGRVDQKNAEDQQKDEQRHQKDQKLCFYASRGALRFSHCIFHPFLRSFAIMYCLF